MFCLIYCLSRSSYYIVSRDDIKNEDGTETSELMVGQKVLANIKKKSVYCSFVYSGTLLECELKKKEENAKRALQSIDSNPESLEKNTKRADLVKENAILKKQTEVMANKIDDYERQIFELQDLVQQKNSEIHDLEEILKNSEDSSNVSNTDFEKEIRDLLRNIDEKVSIFLNSIA